MKNKGTLFIFAAAVMWGIAGLFVRKLSEYGVSPAGTVFYRCFFTALIIGAAMLTVNKNGFKIHIKDLYLFSGNGVFSIVMFNFCYYQTMRLSTLSVAAVLLYTAPIFVMIMSVFLFNEKINAPKALAVVMAFTGCAFVSGIVGNAVKISLLALIYGLLTGFGYALYTVFSNILIKRGYGALTVIFYTFVFAAVGSGFLTAFSGQTVLFGASANVLVWAVLMAVFNTVLPYILYTNGLKFTDASKAPVIATIEPVTATVLGLFYGERLAFFGVLGIILVLSSVIIINLKSGEKV